ncbi:uncharacterized protein LOC115626271 [Scaptodrosophila lebanonensis]|uniref:Uncharacterized protein LOC115626271 n=1 Tax=Drosophila lebanonensis TaxID=7225 RepID=A0A6J2TN34_DROLE|nr:uncharacterized protein LOC115626271 [Scaptodrosophila lebanonensis]
MNETNTKNYLKAEEPTNQLADNKPAIAFREPINISDEEKPPTKVKTFTSPVVAKLSGAGRKRRRQYMAQGYDREEATKLAMIPNLRVGNMRNISHNESKKPVNFNVYACRRRLSGAGRKRQLVAKETGQRLAENRADYPRDQPNAGGSRDLRSPTEEQSYNSSILRLSGAGKKRLKHFLLKGYDHETAKGLAQNPISNRSLSPPPKLEKYSQDPGFGDRDSPIMLVQNPMNNRSFSPPVKRENYFPDPGYNRDSPIRRSQSPMNDRSWSPQPKLERYSEERTFRRSYTETMNAPAVNLDTRSPPVNDRPNLMRAKQPNQKKIKLAVIPAQYPDELWTVNQLTTIQGAILSAIRNQRDGALKPTFARCNLSTGWLQLWCENDGTADWLMETMPRLKLWPGAEARVVPVADMKRSVIYVGYFPYSADSTTDEILQLVEGQNVGLRVGAWRVIHRITKGTAEEIALSVDPASADKLNALGNKLNYAFGRVKMRPKSNRVRNFRPEVRDRKANKKPNTVRTPPNIMEQPSCSSYMMGTSPSPSRSQSPGPPPEADFFHMHSIDQGPEAWSDSGNFGEFGNVAASNTNDMSADPWQRRDRPPNFVRQHSPEWQPPPPQDQFDQFEPNRFNCRSRSPDERQCFQPREQGERFHRNWDNERDERGRNWEY